MFTKGINLRYKADEKIFSAILKDIQDKITKNENEIIMSNDEIHELEIHSSNPERPILKKTYTIDFSHKYRFKLSLVQCHDKSRFYYYGIWIDALPNNDDSDVDKWLSYYFQRAYGIIQELSSHMPLIEEFNLNLIINYFTIPMENNEEAATYLDLLSRASVSKRYSLIVSGKKDIFDSTYKRLEKYGFELEMKSNSLFFRIENCNLIIELQLRYHKIYYMDAKGIKTLGKVLSDSFLYTRGIFLHSLYNVYSNADFYTYAKVTKAIKRAGFSNKTRKRMLELVDETVKRGMLKISVHYLESKYGRTVVRGLLKKMLIELSISPVCIPKERGKKIFYNPIKLINAVEVNCEKIKEAQCS